MLKKAVPCVDLCRELHQSGVKPCSYMTWVTNDGSEYANITLVTETGELKEAQQLVPTYMLQDLLMVLPGCYLIAKEAGTPMYEFRYVAGKISIKTTSNHLADAVAKMVLILIEKDIYTIEQLNYKLSAV